MSVRILTDPDVRRLLTMEACIGLLDDALRTASSGDARNPLRQALRMPGEAGLFGWMPAYLGDPGCVGMKVMTIRAANHGTPYDSHQGAVLLFEVEYGRLVAIADGSAITAVRTAAASGLATRVLAREEASVLAILGSGVQAATHLEAMAAVRELKEVRVWSRCAQNAQRFVDRHQAGYPNLTLRGVANAEEAVRGADLVCTVTAAREPVLRGAWLSEGTHINATGACVAAARELDTEAVARSRLFVDRRESAENESGDYLIPLHEGAIAASHLLGELGEVLLGRVGGRTGAGDITLYDSLGFAVEDVAALRFLLERAEAQDVGQLVDLGGRRPD